MAIITKGVTVTLIIPIHSQVGVTGITSVFISKKRKTRTLLGCESKPKCAATSANRKLAAGLAIPSDVPAMSQRSGTKRGHETSTITPTDQQ